MIVIPILILLCIYFALRGQRPTRGSYLVQHPPANRPLTPPPITAPAARRNP
jgi:hypothetical protein